MRKTRQFAPPDAVEVRRAAAYGRRSRAVFATRAIAAKEVIETCPVIRVPWAELEPPNAPTLADYVFLGRPDPSAGDVFLIALGYGSLYNHSPTPNARFTVRADAVVITALRAIEPGEEVTFDYGYPLTPPATGPDGLEQ